MQENAIFIGVTDLTRVVIWISRSTQDLLDTYEMNEGDDYDALIRRLVFYEKLGLELHFFQIEMEEMEQ